MNRYEWSVKPYHKPNTANNDLCARSICISWSSLHVSLRSMLKVKWNYFEFRVAYGRWLSFISSNCQSIYCFGSRRDRFSTHFLCLRGLIIYWCHHHDRTWLLVTSSKVRHTTFIGNYQMSLPIFFIFFCIPLWMCFSRNLNWNVMVDRAHWNIQFNSILQFLGANE